VGSSWSFVAALGLKYTIGWCVMPVADGGQITPKYQTKSNLYSVQEDAK